MACSGCSGSAQQAWQRFLTNQFPIDSAIVLLCNHREESITLDKESILPKVNLYGKYIEGPGEVSGAKRVSRKHSPTPANFIMPHQD